MFIMTKVEISLNLRPYKLSPQSSQLLFNHGNLGFGVGLLLAFLFDHGGRCSVHELFVGELAHDAPQEALRIFQFFFPLLDFGFDIDAVSQWNEELGAADDKTESAFWSRVNIVDVADIAELADDAVEIL